MQENKKKWMELCEQAADERDPKKLAALILEINFILEAKELTDRQGRYHSTSRRGRLVDVEYDGPPASTSHRIWQQCPQS